MTGVHQNDMTTLGLHIITQKGFAFKSQWYRECGKPLVKVSNFTDDSIDASNLVCIPDDIAKDYIRYELKTGDVVIQTVGSWPNNPQSVVGKVIRIPRSSSGALLNQNAVKIEPDETLDKQYLFYLLRNDDFKKYIIGTAQGAANQASITLDSIKGYSFKLLKLHIQRKIASILSAYDEIIENNTRRIKILEEMSQALYREWFMKFRFPGHEKVGMVESDLGTIPDGWEIKRLGDICSIVPGYAFKSKDWQKTGIPVIKITNINSNNTISVNEVDCVSKEIISPKVKQYMLKNGDFLIAMTGATAGKIGKLRTKSEMLLNQRVAKIDPVNDYREYVWCAISTEESKKRFFKLADGAAQPNMSGSQIEGIKIILPPLHICRSFTDIVEDIQTQVDNLIFRNDTLRGTRDMLLPKLISGEVNVENIDVRMAQ